MYPVHRVVIRDKNPVFEPDMLTKAANRAVLGVGALALLIQLAAIGQVLAGVGQPAGISDHVLFAVVALMWLGLGILVFLQRHEGFAGRFFLLSASGGSVFLALGTLFDASVPNAILYAAGLLLFPPLLFSFTRASGNHPWHHTELLLYVPPALLIWPEADALLHHQTTLWWRLALMLVGAYLVGAATQAFFDFRTARKPEQAAQLRALFFGLIAGTLPGIVIFILPLAWFGTPRVTSAWLPPLVLLFLLAISYAVLLFEFSEADLIVRRGVVYGSMTLAIVVAYGALGVTLTISRSTVTGPTGGLSFVAVTVLIGAAFTPITRAARRLVDWLLYGRSTDQWELLQALSSRLGRVMQPDELGEVLVDEVADALHLRGAFLLRRESDEFVVQHSVVNGSARRDRVPTGMRLEAAAIEVALGEPTGSLLLVHAKPLTADRHQSVPEQYRMLDGLDAALSIPLITRSGLEAVLCLQPKLAHDAFGKDDLELLAPLMRQSVAALDNALLFARLEDTLHQVREAYVRIAREQEAERARLARELHDGTAQELAGLITLAAVVQRQMGEDGPANSTIERLRQQAEDAYQGVRRASHALRPPLLDDFGLAPTLQRFIQQFEEATGIRVEYRAEDLGAINGEVELALFRVAQECMENVRKHSGANLAEVSLERSNGFVKLLVADTGSGMTQHVEPGIGLAGMRERLAAVGGTLEVSSVSGQGVRVAAVAPADTL